MSKSDVKKAFIRKNVINPARQINYPTFPSRKIFLYDNHNKYITTMASNSIKLLTGNSHPELAKKIASRYMIFLEA